MHVVLLVGGWSSERVGTFYTAPVLTAALERLGHRVTAIDVDRNVALKIAEAAPDVVFNGLYGGAGEDGSIQGLLELLNLPYTHSGVAASAIGVDKHLTKQVLQPMGVRMPPGRPIKSEELFLADPLPRPYVLKPFCEGSSIGVVIVTDKSPFGNPIRPDAEGPWSKYNELLVEQYIPGRELTVSVLGRDRALAVSELIPKSNDWYDFSSKYTDGATDRICPANIPDDIYQAALELASRAHRLLGCRGVTRSDIRWDPSQGVDGLNLLELNLQPYISEESSVAVQAKHVGLSYDELIKALIDDALEVHKEKTRV